MVKILNVIRNHRDVIKCMQFVLFINLNKKNENVDFRFWSGRRKPKLAKIERQWTAIFIEH